MGLLDYADTARKKLAGLLGEMPLVQMAQGKAEMPTMSGLLATLKAMPVFSPDAGQSAYDAALNIGPMGLGKIVYHGSPHKFDKFDASKIGTGEGAQAYGHGVYLADNPNVAGTYQMTQKTGGTYQVPDSVKAALKEMDYLGYDTQQQAINHLRTTPTWKETSDLGGVSKSSIAAVDKYLADNPRGALYKADLPDEWIPKMLDWDKPLKDQGEEVRNALRAVIPNEGQTWMKGAVSPKPVTDAAEIAQLNALAKTNPSAIEEAGYYMGSPFDLMTGKDIHYMLGGKAMGSSGAGEKALREAGIPGIRYLDGGSRPNSGRIKMLEQTIANLKGKGASRAAIANTQRELDAELARASYNYVVFPGLEDQVKILERNGVPLSGLLGGQ